jgi:Ca-activated chloride channel family protein
VELVVIEDFHFLRPWWLLALLPLAGVLWMLLKYRFDSSGWRGVIDARLLPFVLTAGTQTGNRWPHALFAIVGTLSILALAGPTWEKQPQPVFQTQSALVILLDLSRSMDATDLKPSRLARARHKIVDLLDRRKQGQTALVVYAADAFTVTPLTDDVDTILALLPSLESAIMPAQGTRVDRALGLAFELLQNGGIPAGDILLLSDGVSSREAQRVELLWRQQSSHRLSVLAVGTPQGGPIPLRSGGFLEDSEGSIVVAGLDRAGLRDLAAMGGGVYAALASNDADIDAISATLESGLDIDGTRRVEGSADLWRELGPWLVLLALPFAALGFRRGLLWLCPLVLLLPSPEADAFEWADLWRNTDQYASELFEQGEHAEAARLFDDPSWSASALYRSGDYESAAELWQGIDDQTADYNRGNALARMGRYIEAIEAYEAALARNPDHADARYNKERIEEWLQNQPNPGTGENQPQQSDGQESESQELSQAQARNGEQPENADEGPQEQSGQNAQEDPGDQGTAEAEALPQPESDDASGQEHSLAALEEQMSEQAAEQWLRKIPDDPGGLLRRKFLYQYRDRGGVDEEDQSW